MSDCPQWEQQAVEMLQWLKELVEKGGDFVMQQAPPLAAEIVTYGRVTNSLAVLALIPAAILLKLYIPRIGKAIDEDDDGLVVVKMALVIVVGILGVGLFVANLDQFLKAWFAPRLYLIDYLGKLLS